MIYSVDSFINATRASVSQKLNTTRSLARAGLPNVHSVHVHSRPHHRGGPTTMANMKIVIDLFLETDSPHCGYCFKSFSLCILVQFCTARRKVELTPLRTGRLFPRVWADWDANNFVPYKNGMTIWASAAK